MKNNKNYFKNLNETLNIKKSFIFVFSFVFTLLLALSIALPITINNNSKNSSIGSENLPEEKPTLNDGEGIYLNQILEFVVENSSLPKTFPSADPVILSLIDYSADVVFNGNVNIDATLTRPDGTSVVESPLHIETGTEEVINPNGVPFSVTYDTIPQYTYENYGFTYQNMSAFKFSPYLQYVQCD